MEGFYEFTSVSYSTGAGQQYQRIKQIRAGVGQEFSEEETLKILLNAYKHFSGQAADHMAVHLGLDKILSQEEMDKIYSFEANVEQKDR